MYKKIGAVTRTCCVDLSLRPLQGESAGRENRSAGRVSGATSPEHPENVKQFSVVIAIFEMKCFQLIKGRKKASETAMTGT